MNAKQEILNLTSSHQTTKAQRDKAQDQIQMKERQVKGLQNYVDQIKKGDQKQVQSEAFEVNSLRACLRRDSEHIQDLTSELEAAKTRLKNSDKEKQALVMTNQALSEARNNLEEQVESSYTGPSSNKPTTFDMTAGALTPRRHKEGDQGEDGNTDVYQECEGEDDNDEWNAWWTGQINDLGKRMTSIEEKTNQNLAEIRDNLGSRIETSCDRLEHLINHSRGRCRGSLC